MRLFALALMTSVLVPLSAFAQSQMFENLWGFPGSQTPQQGVGQGSSAYPIGPNPTVTTGSLCAHADQIRYPEHIPYCRRDVEREVKQYVLRMYDEKFGYHIAQMNRQDFKIDHLIPLCAGGSNEVDNLWPQHKSVFAITDPLEPAICGKMAEGKLLQREAVELIKQAKNDLTRVQDILNYVLSK